MKKKHIKFLRSLVETPSPTGAEEPVAALVRTRLSSVADEVQTNTMGSVHAVLEGKANKVIARDLGLEVSTVKMHRANAFAKLGVHSPAELTRLAFESGYADAKTTLS